MTRHFFRASAAAAALLTGLAAQAQPIDDLPETRRAEAVEEIIILAPVTTRNRTEGINPELVYGQEFFQRFEPLSVGDALKRVPGVSFTTDVGEFDDPGLRGLANGFTQILINGRPIPSAGGGDGTARSVFVDRIPAELVDRIEVIRSPSADIDAQGVAGTINIILKDGANLPDGGYVRGGAIYYRPTVDGDDGTIRGLGAVGYAGSALDDKLNFSVNLNAQQRFNQKFSIQEEFDPEKRANVGAARDALAFDAADSLVGDGEVRAIQSDVRENFDIAVNADIAYRFDAGHDLSLRGFYINTDRTEREDGLVFEDAPDNLVEIGAQDTQFDQENFGLDARYTHRLGDATDLFLRAAYTKFDNLQTETDLEAEPDDLGGALPDEAGFRTRYSVADLPLPGDEQEIFDIEDAEWQLEASAERRLTGLAQRLGLADLAAKAGFQARLKDRNSSLQVFGFDDGQVDLSDPTPSDLGGVFDVTENRYDSFVMVTWQLTDRLELETGARFEVTRTTLDGIADGAPRSAQTNDFNANPSAHLRYTINDWASARLSYAQTVRRPEFNQRVPFSLDDQPDDLDVTTGNPDLEIETSDGVDAGLEFSLPGRGVMGVNGFYRRVDNVIQLVNLGPTGETEIDDGDVIVGDAFRFDNVGTADVWGVEFDLSTPLGFIGLPDTGLFANYTYLRSELDNTFTQSKVQLNGQPDYVFNVGGTHSVPAWGLSFGASYQRQGDAFSYFRDEIQRSTVSGNLEAFVEKRLLPGVILRLSANNILDAETIESEENFDGPITGGQRDNYEIEREEAQRRIQLTLRAVF
ncbi:TonB-dependent receptor [Rhodothalassium salexigens DSM 2132]|uniref:TonB-dependent receptor n=1 Tax=Rhodothalassium salexigens DSM 2132 TaxID=1188247 RepID=A0A4R2PG65_RHOSA|nr:TonB-dependent receptor [Rhodothalassium salexigens]MBB4212060.1 outer membrane receptor protein involved in Fe transport [Rhodothalassium salexigens DSM 2132]MBK1638087.1 hypothetical protein [Rhodothalassium salexigens DSM 2132]TCP32935.1 TonB-dependent receptor [Rhodothalassium salexigens DSM 2132]